MFLFAFTFYDLDGSLIILVGKKSWSEVADFCSFVVNPLQLADYLIFSFTT